MKQTTVFALILGFLLLISVVQAFQLNALKHDLAEGEMTIGSTSARTSTATSAPASSGSTGSLPSSIQNLPTMVGGC